MTRSHSQESLTAFDSGEPSQPRVSDEVTGGDDPSEDLVKIDTSGTDFRSPSPGSYPADEIDALASGETIINLCTPDRTVSPTFRTIAGSGGMGATKSIEVPSTIAETLEACLSYPVLITGGGMNTPMGSGAVLGRLREVGQSEDTVHLEIDELYQHRGTSRQETRSVRLGAYEVSLPESATDCQQATRALSAWEREAVEYLNPRKRRKHEVAVERLDTFQSLSPADKLDTPEYATRLEVVSEPFETYAVVPRGTLSTRTISVLAVAVNNPNGGYYELGIEQPASRERTTDLPTCYLSTSQQSPPTPNTAFTRDAKFSSTDLDVMPIKHPPDPEVIPPDEEILGSPLPEPRLRTSVDEIKGIGEQTARKLYQATDGHVSAESIAYTLFGDEDIHAPSRGEIEDILGQLPRTEQVRERLEGYVEK